jgi:hypothetical protein
MFILGDKNKTKNVSEQSSEENILTPKKDSNRMEKSV